MYLLCEIYKDKGYYIDYNEDLVFDIADFFALEDKVVIKIIESCVKIDLFNEELFKNNILTSRGIQKRFLKIKERTLATIEKYNVLDISTSNNLAETAVFDVITEVNEAKTVVNDIVTAQNKIIDIKEKIEIKENNFRDFLLKFNKLRKTTFRSDLKTERQFKQRIKEGYSIEQLILALKSAMSDSFFKKINYVHLTPEYITRGEILNKYLNFNTLIVNTIESQQKLKHHRFSTYDEALIQYPKMIELSIEADLARKNYDNVESDWLRQGYIALVMIGQKKYLAKKKEN
jgi:hypothetical protein